MMMMLLATGFQMHSRSELVIVQEADWTELAEFFNEKAPDNVKKTVKTQAGHSCLARDEDDRGVEGVIVVPDNKKRKVVVGTRMSADIDQALAEPGDDESQQQEAEPVPSDAESDGATFGLKRSVGGTPRKKGGKAKTKPGPGARPRIAAPPSDRENSVTSQRPVKKEKQMSTEKIQRTLDAGQAALRALKSMTPVQYWSGGAKEKDLQTKVGKALSSCTALESLETNKDATSLREELQNLVETTNSWSEILDKFRLSDPLMVLQIQTEDVAKLAKQIPVDAVAAVVTEIARKLVEASCLVRDLWRTQLQSAQSHNTAMATKAFFRFIALADLDQPGLSLFALHRTEDKVSGLDEKSLLRIQGNIFNIWLNSTKTSAEIVTMAYGDDPSTDTLAADGDNANCSGLVPRLLVDLQKFMACGKVSIDDQSMPDQGLLSDPAKVNELKMVVQSGLLNAP
eukprot:s3934_g8.t1